MEKVVWYKNRHLLLALVAGIVVFIIVRSYVHHISVIDDEPIAFAVTMVLLATVYTGRFLALLLIDERHKVSMIGLPVFVIITILSFFFSSVFVDKMITREDFSHNFIFWIAFVILGISLGIVIKLFRTKIYEHLREAQIQASHSQSELETLQSQLSPHFLFNTLNNMYGLSITTPEKIPALLLRLSDLLRYSVYDAKEMFVPLKDELEYINNYIEFEKIRIGERLHLNSVMDNFEGDILIAPMLLIVFVENAFKHSKNTMSSRIYIDIVVRRWSDTILFSVKNSKGDEPHERRGGLGIANVKKRLGLLYRGEYDLSIQEEASHYTVQLQLKIKSNEKDQLSDSR